MTYLKLCGRDLRKNGLGLFYLVGIKAELSDKNGTKLNLPWIGDPYEIDYCREILIDYNDYFLDFQVAFDDLGIILYKYEL